MRKGLTASVLFASVVLAGCSGGGTATAPPTSEPAETATPPSSSRTAPVKSLQVDDACSVLTPEQQQALGANQPPRARESRGMQGCNFMSGDAGTAAGWNAFVSVTTTQTMQKFMKMHTTAEPTTVAGYPAANTVINNRNCTVSVDVSDKGSVVVNGMSRDESVNGCDAMKKVAEAVVQNLPNA